jgi:PepSY-associated transmembrane protein
MTIRALHRVVGLVMLLPLVGWAVTGAFFFLKPGYSGAYELLQVKTYPLEATMALRTDPSWLEVRLEKTILGDHLLARTSKGWLHLDPRTFEPRPEPAADEIRMLVTDAFSINPARYGRVASVEGNNIETDTGVRVALDWKRLMLAQRGKDTKRIDTIYKIHYLQWTGFESVDKVLGALGILLTLVLSLLGARLLLRRG